MKRRTKMMYIKITHHMIKFCMLFMLSETLNCKYLPCIPKDFGHGSVVCMCNSTYCDEFVEPVLLKEKEYVVYTSTKDGQRFNESINHTKTKERQPYFGDVLNIFVNASVEFQTILGFGGAFTDAATLNIFNMSSELQQHVFDAYYSKNGIGYTIGRIPMASCDFSTHIYSYDDYDGDFALKNFKLTEEDLKLKIPAIKIATKTAKHGIKLFGSPWAAPGWMKTNKKMQNPGKLIGNVTGVYYKTWANYFVKFLQEYEKNGVKVWGLTVENEPNAGLSLSYDFQCMGFTDAMERDFVKNVLGPALVANGYKDVKLMMLDDQRLFVSVWAKTILGDPEAKKYISGIGVHWYMDEWVTAKFLDDAHERFPDVFILSTEACAGYGPDGHGVLLGSWERGESYGRFIMEDLNHWSVGWTDWNLVLNMEGGPNWVKNFVDAPIIADFENHVIYKQPTFYHMGHFSRFVEPGSFRISTKTNAQTSLEIIAFVTPSKMRVLVILNRQPKDFMVQISEEKIGKFTWKIPARSIQTFQWNE